MDVSSLAAAVFPAADSPCRACLGTTTSKHWPAPPHGPLSGLRADVLMIGWNPQIGEYEPPPPSAEAWIQHGESKARDAAEYFWWLFGHRDAPAAEREFCLQRRIVNTRMWRWPGVAGKYRPEDRAAGWSCANAHLLDEIRIAQPKVILTYNDQAAAFIAVQPQVPASNPLGGASHKVVRGWIAESNPWGFNVRIILASGSKARSRQDRLMIRAAARECLL